VSAPRPVPPSTRDELDALKGLLANMIDLLGGNDAHACARTLSDPDLIREQAVWFRTLVKQQLEISAPDTEMQSGPGASTKEVDSHVT
jgi:hypothetical protein